MTEPEESRLIPGKDFLQVGDQVTRVGKVVGSFFNRESLIRYVVEWENGHITIHKRWELKKDGER